MEQSNSAIDTIIAENTQLRRQLDERTAELAQSKTLLQSVVDTLHQAICWKDRNFVYQGCDTAFATMTGIAHPADIVGKTDEDLTWDKAEAEMFRIADHRVMESDTPELDIIESIHNATGHHRWVKTNKVPIHDVEGNVVGIFSTIEDITEKTIAEEELRIFKIALEKAPDGFTLSSQTSLLYANDSFHKMSGYSENLIGMTVRDIVLSDEHELIFNTIFPALEQEGSWSGTVQMQRQDGSVWTAHVTSIRIDGETIKRADIWRDITAQVEAEQEQATIKQQVIEAQQASIRELSSPILPLADGVLAMPLVGSIDSSRAQQIMEALLEGVFTYHTNVAIIDITGIQVVDTQVANVLLQMTQAVNLLGAKVILTGISPSIAQTLVSLGVDLSGVVAKSTLQTGIAYALDVNRSNM